MDGAEGNKHETLCGQLALLQVQLFRFAVSIILKRIPNGLEVFYETLRNSAIEIGAAFTDCTMRNCSAGILCQVKQMIKDSYGTALDLLKTNQKQRCASLLSLFYTLGKSFVDANMKKVSSSNENEFEALKLDVVAGLLSSCRHPVDAVAVLREALRYGTPMANDGSSYMANVSQYLKSTLTIISGNIESGNETEATASLQKYINDVCLSGSSSSTKQSIVPCFIQALCRTHSDIVNSLRQSKEEQLNGQGIILRACTDVLKAIWNRGLMEIERDRMCFKLKDKIGELLSIRIELITICGLYYASTKSVEKVIESCVCTHKSASRLLISLKKSKEIGTQNEQQSAYLHLCLACTLTWKCIVTLKTLMFCSYTGTALSNIAKEYDTQITEQSAERDIAASIDLYLSGFSKIPSSKEDGYFACFMKECLLHGIEAISKAVFFIGTESKYRNAICTIWNTAIEHAHLTSDEAMKWLSSCQTAFLLFNAGNGHDTTELITLRHFSDFHHDQALKKNLITDLFAIDDGITQCGRYLETRNFGALCVSLAETAKQLTAIKSDTPVLSRTLEARKAISMREVLLRHIYCSYQICRGHAHCAVDEMKISFILCSKLAKKFGYTECSVKLHANSLKETLLERSAASHCGIQTLKMRGELLESTKQGSLIYFQAIETMHWDLLVITTKSMCRLASLYSALCQPKRYGILTLFHSNMN